MQEPQMVWLNETLAYDYGQVTVTIGSNITHTSCILNNSRCWYLETNPWKLLLSPVVCQYDALRQLQVDM